MKVTQFIRLLTVAIVLAIAATGCKKKPINVTEIPNKSITGSGSGSGVGNPDGGKPLSPGDGGSSQVGSTPGGAGGQGVNSDGSIPPVSPDKYANYIPNREIFKEYTVYFDYDSAAVKSGEMSKVSHVAEYMKAHPDCAVKVEGNCDERGTEDYNKSLGERRALAVREALSKDGVPADTIPTTSFGKDNPADPGHDEAAWKKNRRADFVLLTPPAKP